MIKDYYLKTCDLPAFLSDMMEAGVDIGDYKGGLYTGESIFIDELSPIIDECELVDANDDELITELSMSGQLGVNDDGAVVKVLSYIDACHFNVRVWGMVLDTSRFVNTEVMSPNTPKAVIF